jgi:hypothetical protein
VPLKTLLQAPLLFSSGGAAELALAHAEVGMPRQRRGSRGAGGGAAGGGGGAAGGGGSAAGERAVIWRAEEEAGGLLSGVLSALYGAVTSGALSLTRRASFAIVEAAHSGAVSAASAATAAAGRLTAALATDWTRDPNVALVRSLSELQALADELEQRGPLDERAQHGAELLEMGRRLKELAGWCDQCFFQELPARGAGVLVFMAQCPLYDKSICDADRAAGTLSGAFLAGFERALRVPIVRANIAGRCWRSASNDNCQDPHGATLDALVIVKRIFFLCLRRAGLRVLRVALSSAAAIGSLGGAAQPHFATYFNTDLGLHAFNSPHIKYTNTSLQPWLYDNISVSIGGARTEGALVCASRMLSGFAEQGALMLGEKDKGRRIYAAMLADAGMRDKGVVGRAWDDRFGDGVDEAAEAAAKAAKRRKSIAAGVCDAYAVLVRSHGTPRPRA